MEVMEDKASERLFSVSEDGLNLFREEQEDFERRGSGIKTKDCEVAE
jgi:hypothetical protein